MTAVPKPVIPLGDGPSLSSFLGVGDAGVRRAVFSVFGVASSIRVNSSSEDSPSPPSVLILGAGLIPLASASLDVDCGAGTVGGGVSGSWSSGRCPSSESVGVACGPTWRLRSRVSASARSFSSSLSRSSSRSRSNRSSSRRISLCILCVRFLKLSSEPRRSPSAVMTSNMWTKSAVCPSDGVKPQSTKNRSVSGSTPSGSISCSHRPKLRSCLEVRGLTGTTAPTVAPRSSSQNSEFDVFLCRTRRVTSLPSSSVPATRVVSASDPYLSTCLSCSFRASFTTSSAMTTMSSRSSRKNSPDAHSGALTP